MTEPRASRANTVGGGSFPLVDPTREDFDAQSFMSGQLAMAAIAAEIVKLSHERGRFRLNLSLFLDLHRAGYLFVDQSAGFFRQDQVSIENSRLSPPSPDKVLYHLEEMCDYINDNFFVLPILHLSAYAMWRFLWIHPFNEGNGSVARLIAYTIIQIKERSVLPGSNHMFEYLAENRGRYYAALSLADERWAEGLLDLHDLETLLKEALYGQLQSTL